MHQKTKKSRFFSFLMQYIFLFTGAFLASIGLEIFLIPNNIIDGGVVGISIITSYLTRLPLGIFIIIFNIPFLILGYKHIGKTFVISTIFSVCCLSVFVTFLHPVPGLTDDLFLSSVFGGIILGFGVGLIIRYGGSLDGTEIVAIILDRKTSFSVGEIIMFFNIFILATAGIVFGWDRAMYSLFTYFIAFKVIDITIEGLDESRSVFVISEHSEIIAETLMARLGRSVTFFNGRGGFSKQSRDIIYLVITRLEIAKVKLIIKDIDVDAFVTIGEVHDVMGKNLKKKVIH